jgi:hypothetical protein
MGGAETEAAAGRKEELGRRAKKKGKRKIERKKEKVILLTFRYFSYTMYDSFSSTNIMIYSSPVCLIKIIRDCFIYRYIKNNFSSISGVASGAET